MVNYVDQEFDQEYFREFCQCLCHEDGEPWCNECFDDFHTILTTQEVREID